MAKKIGIIVLLCFSLCVGGVSAFADEGHAGADTQALIETQPPVSSVLFRQDGADIQQSTDEGKTWQSYIAAHIQDGGGCGIEADSVQEGKCLLNLSGTGGQLQTDSFFSFSPAQSQQNHRYIPPI